jgi:hypothetical protein
MTVLLAGDNLTNRVTATYTNTKDLRFVEHRVGPHLPAGCQLKF